MTLVQFSEIFGMLAMQLRNLDADEITIKAYYEALKDLEPEMVIMAAGRIGAKGQFFPKTSEWREEAAKLFHERQELQRAVMRKLQTPLCGVCGDTGWELQEPDEQGYSRVRACACRGLRRLEVLGRRPMPMLSE